MLIKDENRIYEAPAVKGLRDENDCDHPLLTIKISHIYGVLLSYHHNLL